MPSAEYRVQKRQGGAQNAGAGSKNQGRGKPAFVNLLVWQKAQDLAPRIAEIVDELPKKRSPDILAKQALQSPSSVPANIAEGYGRFSEPAYRSFLSIARGSLYETESTLDLLRRRRHLTGELCDSLIQDSEEVARLITATMKSLKSVSRAVREEGPEYEV